MSQNPVYSATVQVKPALSSVIVGVGVQCVMRMRQPPLVVYQHKRLSYGKGDLYSHSSLEIMNIQRNN